MRSIASGSRVRHELTITRSRFITTLAHTPTESAARALIAQVRAEFPDARHHCTAFVIKPDGLNEIGHSSDDGEPSGTAGMPMLEVLRRENMVNVTAVVTRYFGGVLLGTGGLVRAYSTSVSEALARAQRVTLAERDVWEFTIDHALSGRVDAQLRSREIPVLNIDYSDRVCIRCAPPPDHAQWLTDALAQWSAGTAIPTVVGRTVCEFAERESSPLDK